MIIKYFQYIRKRNRRFRTYRVRTHIDSTSDKCIKFIFLLLSKQDWQHCGHNETKSHKTYLFLVPWSVEGEGEVKIESLQWVQGCQPDGCELNWVRNRQHSDRTTVKRKALPSIPTDHSLIKLFNRINLLNMPANTYFICFQYLLTGISSFYPGFPSNFAWTNSLLRSWDIRSLVTRHYIGRKTRFQALRLK